MSSIPEVFTGHRVETHWINLLDGDDNLIEKIDGTSGGVVTQNIDAPIRGSFQFTMKADSKPFDYMRVRFRPWVRVNGQDWPLGVFVPSSPTVRSSSSGLHITIPSHDKTILLERDKIVQTYSLPAGTPVVETVVGLLQALGEESVAVTESDAVTPIPMTWTVGTSWLKVINDLLRSVNYTTIWADGFGQFRIEPHIEPARKVPRYRFQAGALSIHSPDWERTRDIANVPNRVVLIATGTDEQEEMIAVAENTDPDSDFSIQARGGIFNEDTGLWEGGIVTRPYENVEAADQATLDALAQRYLANATRAVAHLSVSHAILPLDPGDVVLFKASRLPDLLLAQVKEFSIPLKTGALVKATWTEVGS